MKTGESLPFFQAINELNKVRESLSLKPIDIGQGYGHIWTDLTETIDVVSLKKDAELAAKVLTVAKKISDITDINKDFFSEALVDKERESVFRQRFVTLEKAQSSWSSWLFGGVIYGAQVAGGYVKGKAIDIATNPTVLKSIFNRIKEPVLDQSIDTLKKELLQKGFHKLSTECPEEMLIELITGMEEDLASYMCTNRFRPPPPSISFLFDETSRDLNPTGTLVLELFFKGDDDSGQRLVNLGKILESNILVIFKNMSSGQGISETLIQSITKSIEDAKARKLRGGEVVPLESYSKKITDEILKLGFPLGSGDMILPVTGEFAFRRILFSQLSSIIESQVLQSLQKLDKFLREVPKISSSTVEVLAQSAANSPSPSFELGMSLLGFLPIPELSGNQTSSLEKGHLSPMQTSFAHLVGDVACVTFKKLITTKEVEKEKESVVKELVLLGIRKESIQSVYELAVSFVDSSNSVITSYVNTEIEPPEIFKDLFFKYEGKYQFNEVGIAFSRLFSDSDENRKIIAQYIEVNLLKALCNICKKTTDSTFTLPVFFGMNAEKRSQKITEFLLKTCFSENAKDFILPSVLEPMRSFLYTLTFSPLQNVIQFGMAEKEGIPEKAKTEEHVKILQKISNQLKSPFLAAATGLPPVAFPQEQGVSIVTLAAEISRVIVKGIFKKELFEAELLEVRKNTKLSPQAVQFPRKFIDEILFFYEEQLSAPVKRNIPESVAIFFEGGELNEMGIVVKSLLENQESQEAVASFLEINVLKMLQNTQSFFEDLCGKRQGIFENVMASASEDLKNYSLEESSDSLHEALSDNLPANLSDILMIMATSMQKTVFLPKSVEAFRPILLPVLFSCMKEQTKTLLTKVDQGSDNMIDFMLSHIFDKNVENPDLSSLSSVFLNKIENSFLVYAKKEYKEDFPGKSLPSDKKVIQHVSKKITKSQEKFREEIVNFIKLMVPELKYLFPVVKRVVENYVDQSLVYLSLPVDQTMNCIIETIDETIPIQELLAEKEQEDAGITLAEGRQEEPSTVEGEIGSKPLKKALDVPLENIRAHIKQAKRYVFYKVGSIFMSFLNTMVSISPFPSKEEKKIINEAISVRIKRLNVIGKALVSLLREESSAF